MVLFSSTGYFLHLFKWVTWSKWVSITKQSECQSAARRIAMKKKDKDEWRTEKEEENEKSERQKRGREWVRGNIEIRVCGKSEKK